MDVNRVIKLLETAVQDTLTEADLKEIAEMGLSIIKLRTRRGKYLPGSKSPAAYSPGHARVRRKLGLPTNRVTLFMGEVGVLEGIKTRVKSEGGEISAEIGYIEGKTEQEALQIGRWLDTEGAGVNKVRYRHIGFTSSERDRLVQFAKKLSERN